MVKIGWVRTLKRVRGKEGEKDRKGEISGLSIVLFFFICSIATKIKRRKI